MENNLLSLILMLAPLEQWKNAIRLTLLDANYQMLLVFIKKRLLQQLVLFINVLSIWLNDGAYGLSNVY
jgi:hypothetical protein